MASPIVLQNLLDAAADAQTLAAVINSPASVPYVVSRLGTHIPTLAYTLATMATGGPINSIAMVDQSPNVPAGTIATITVVNQQIAITE